MYPDRQTPPNTRNQSYLRRKGVVNHVPGLKRKGCPGTLKPLRLRRGRRAAACIERYYTGPFEGPPIIKPPALLRNNIDGDELEPEFSGLCVKPGRFLVLPALLLFLKDGGVVWLLGGDQVKDDPGKLMGGSGHGLRSTHAGFHAAEVVSEETVAAV